MQSGKVRTGGIQKLRQKLGANFLLLRHAYPLLCLDGDADAFLLVPWASGDGGGDSGVGASAEEADRVQAIFLREGSNVEEEKEEERRDDDGEESRSCERKAEDDLGHSPLAPTPAPAPPPPPPPPTPTLSDSLQSRSCMPPARNSPLMSLQKGSGLRDAGSASDSSLPTVRWTGMERDLVRRACRGSRL